MNERIWGYFDIEVAKKSLGNLEEYKQHLAGLTFMFPNVQGLIAQNLIQRAFDDLGTGNLSIEAQRTGKYVVFRRNIPLINTEGDGEWNGWFVQARYELNLSDSGIRNDLFWVSKYLEMMLFNKVERAKIPYFLDELSRYCLDPDTKTRFPGAYAQNNEDILEL